jgi:hypothetical protein
MEAEDQAVSDLRPLLVQRPPIQGKRKEIANGQPAAYFALRNRTAADCAAVRVKRVATAL